MKDAQEVELSQLSEGPSGATPTPQSIASRVFLDCNLNLKAIALQTLNAEYNPKRLDAVIMRLREPKTTAVIYASGMLVCLGANSEGESRLATRKYARIIQKTGYNAKFKDFKVLRRVGTCTSFCVVAPIIHPQLDKDRAKLNALCMRHQRNEISKGEYLRLVEDIMGHQMYRMAAKLCFPQLMMNHGARKKKNVLSRLQVPVQQ